MEQLRSCHYNLCYYNNNIQSVCLKNSVTISFAGVCESLEHCYKYVCSDCDKFEVCSKQKNRNTFIIRGYVNKRVSSITF